mmetsp:Transcript_11992/g.21876  ORF Transcript_11992/g.21876 Transcript_11992/m.21876 type:complete len:177 (-) Transcript_11992:387-917(-)
MAVTFIAYPSVFFFLGILYAVNGFLLYACSWNWSMMHWASQIYGRGTFTSNSRLNSHLQRNSAILMLGSSILNIIAASSRSNSIKRVASYWDYVLISHYAIELYTGQIGGSALTSIAMMLALILYYEHREENLFANPEEIRRKSSAYRESAAALYQLHRESRSSSAYGSRTDSGIH